MRNGAMAKRRSSRLKGAEGFEAFYGDLFGDRWPALRDALAREPIYHELDEGLVKPYYLDEASWYAAHALAPESGRVILDLCAAPGGKSLVIAGRMPRDASLVCNERSATRRRRLRTVLDEHLPPQTRARVEISGHDAREWGLHERNRYDRVLVDVPCSSERHVLSSPVHLAQWGRARSKRLAAQAVGMLAAAVDAASPGGLIVYSTCTVLPAEDDEVVKRVLERRRGVVELDKPTVRLGRFTETGALIRPDTDGGRGPMFIARLAKRTAN